MVRDSLHFQFGQRDHSCSATRDMGRRIAHPVNAAALPGGFEGALYGSSEAAVGVRDDELFAAQPTGFEAAQDVHPEGLGF